MQAVVVATFAHRHEAEFARATLESAGIDSLLIADDAGGAYAGLSFTNQVRLLVREEDVEEARQLLAEGEEDGESPD